MNNLSDLDKVLMNIDLVASFRNLGSKTELNGNKCKLLNDYIKNLEILVELLYCGVELNDKQYDLLDKVLNNKIGK